MSVQVIHLETYQAECDRCGWHTRQAEGVGAKRWAKEMAKAHQGVCPIPTPTDTTGEEGS